MLKKLDQKDYKILSILVKNGEATSKDISKETGIGDKTIRNRIKNMKDSRVFRKAIIINPELFGYHIKVDIFVKVEEKLVDQFIDKITKEFPHNISYIGIHWGDDDVSLQCFFKESQDILFFRSFIVDMKISSIVNMKIVPFVFKDTFDWIPSESDFKAKE